MGWEKVKFRMQLQDGTLQKTNNEAVGLGIQYGWVAFLQQLAERRGTSWLLKIFGLLSLLIKSDHDPQIPCTYIKKKKSLMRESGKGNSGVSS